MIDDTIIELTDRVGIGIGAACKAVGRPRATHHRRVTRRHGPPAPPASRKGHRQPRALSEEERAETLRVLRDERFVDQAPASVYATLLDENRYLCSISTMYRLLREQGETGERRRQATHPPKVKPELVASGPNQVYSWDITKLAGPAKWTYYYLYVIIDIYSRYVPGWLLADRESSTLAEQLLADTCFKQNIGHGQLTIHADRGSSMASKPVALLLADLGVTKSHSRPHTSNDNPFSEAQFKTEEVPARLPRPVRLARARPSPLPTVLRLVQRRASSQRCRPDETRRRALRTRTRDHRRPRQGPRRRVHRQTRTVRPQPAATTPARRHDLDQPARRRPCDRDTAVGSVVSQRSCLTKLDRFRGRRRPPPPKRHGGHAHQGRCSGPSAGARVRAPL